jgi:hypothetical protein
VPPRPVTFDDKGDGDVVGEGWITIEAATPESSRVPEIDDEKLMPELSGPKIKYINYRDWNTINIFIYLLFDLLFGNILFDDIIALYLHGVAD